MPGLFDQASVDRIQQANNIVDLVGEFVSLTRKGREWVGLCPFHDDHRPSMYVSDSKQLFKCFACGAGGDVFKFVQMRENLTFPQSIQRLAERAGITLEPIRSAGRRDPRDTDQADSAMLARANEWAAKFFEANLQDPDKGKAALDYVAQRGITPEGIKRWRLGLATGGGRDLADAAAKKGIPGSLLVGAGLVTSGGQDKFCDRLMFPIIDVTGRVIAFGGRTLVGDSAKYVNSPTTVLFDKSNSLYGLVRARQSIISQDWAVVVEGYTDCILAHEAGIENVVATLGTSLTSGHGRILRRYAKTVVLVFDSDTAGMAATNRVLDVCLRQRIDVKVTSVPDGKDPADFILAKGGEAFKNVLEQAVEVMEYKWNRLRVSFKSDLTLAGRKAAIEEFLQTVATSIWSGNISTLDRGIVVHRLSSMIGLEPKQIDSELRRRIVALAKPTKDTPVQVESSEGWGLKGAAQREVLEVLLNEPRLWVKARKTGITVESFTVPSLRLVAVPLFELLESKGQVSPVELLARIESIEVAQDVAGLTEVGHRKGNFDARLDEALGVLGGPDRISGQTDRIIDVLERTAEQCQVRDRYRLGLTE